MIIIATMIPLAMALACMMMLAHMRIEPPHPPPPRKRITRDARGRFQRID